MEDVRIPYSEGKTLDASWLQHTGSTLKGRAVLLPGYLDTHRYPHLKRLAESLQSRGWDVMCFSPRGTWESNGVPAEYTISNYLRDIQSVLTWLSERTSTQTTYLIGHSLGGLVSLLSAAQLPGITGVVAIMPPSQLTALNLLPLRLRWKILGRKTFKQDIPNNPKERKTFVIPYSFVQDAAQYKGKQIVRQLKQRVLFIAGSEDRLIPTRHVQALAQEHQPAFPCIVVEGARHIYRKNPQSIRNINQIIIDFLQ